MTMYVVLKMIKDIQRSNSMRGSNRKSYIQIKRLKLKNLMLLSFKGIQKNN